MKPARVCGDGLQNPNVFVRYQRRSGARRTEAGEPSGWAVIGIRSPWPMALRTLSWTFQSRRLLRGSSLVGGLSAIARGARSVSRYLASRRPAVAETTALGAAYLAGLAVGYWQDPADVTRNWALDREFTPGAGASDRDVRYRRWQRAVERSRDWDKP